MKAILIFLFSLCLIVPFQKASAVETFGNGMNGYFIHSIDSNVGFFGMESFNVQPFHGQRFVKFFMRSWGNGSVILRKTYSQAIQRSTYTECVAFVKLFDLMPAVSNVYLGISFYISEDGQNFFLVGETNRGRGAIGPWVQHIMGFTNNAPQSIVATQIVFQVYFSGNPASDSIRCESGVDYWSFSSFSYPQIIIDDFEGGISGIHNQNEVAEKFSLSQNYPNPFNPTTVISFQVADYGPVSLKVYDISGREIETLVNEGLKPGTYKVDWNASNFSSGTYFYRFTAGDFTETKKMILIK